MRKGSWQVLCWDRSMAHEGPNRKPGVANALRFATIDEAKAYGRDLFGRWMGLDHWEPAESKDPVNYIWAFEEGGYGKAIPAISIPQVKSAQTLLKRKTTFANLRTVLEKQKRIGQEIALILRDGSRALVTSDEKSLEVRAL